MTDIEIAQKNVMEPITDVASKIGIKKESLELYGNYKAKISVNELKTLQEKASKTPGKLILATIKMRTVFKLSSQNVMFSGLAKATERLFTILTSPPFIYGAISIPSQTTGIKPQA